MLSWGLSSGTVDGYILRQSHKPVGGSWSPYRNVYQGTARSHTATGLAPGAYRYQVRAYNRFDDFTAYSPYRSTDDTLITVEVLTAPTLTGPTINVNGHYTLSWNAVAGATRYELEERHDHGNWSTVHNALTHSKALSGNDDGRWDYRLRACSTALCSDWSTIHTVTIALPPGLPGTILVDPLHTTSDQHTISWGAASGNVVNYSLRQSYRPPEWQLVALSGDLFRRWPKPYRHWTGPGRVPLPGRGPKHR